MIQFDPTPWKAPMKTVSEQQKAKDLISLTEEDLGPLNHKFVQGTLKTFHQGDKLGVLSARQTNYFHDLWDKHFNSYQGG
jgi:hypothetical protein